MSHTQHIAIEADEDGRVLATAEVHTNPYLIQAQLRVEPGPLPDGVRARLVDAVLDLHCFPPGRMLEMTLPADDTEMLNQVRQRCGTVQTRTAGASCLLRTTAPAP